MRGVRAIRTGVVGGILAVAMLATASDARADTQQQADALFNEGRELLERGRWAEACAKLRESEQLAPAIGTLLNLGYCWEQLGRMRSAMEAYGEAEVLAASAADAKRTAVAKERYAAAEKRAPRLVVRVAPQPMTDIEITRNGVTMAKTDFDRPMPVDPEDYVIVASAPSYQPWRGVVVVRGDGATVTLVVPALAPAGATTSAAPVAHASPWTPKRYLSLGLMGAGLALIGSSVGAGLSAKSRFDDSASHCNYGCDPIGVEIQSNAAAQANIATLLFALGLGAIGGGIYFWIAGAPPDAPNKAGTLHGLGGRF